MLVLRALTRLNSRFVPFSLKPDSTTAQTTPQTTAQPNCHRRACMYDWTTVRQDDHAFSECPLLQVFKNALFVSRLGSGPRFWLRIAPHTVRSVHVKLHMHMIPRWKQLSKCRLYAVRYTLYSNRLKSCQHFKLHCFHYLHHG